MIKTILGAFLFFICANPSINAQDLKAGFDKAEYLEMMKLSARTTQSSKYYNTIPEPLYVTQTYVSPVMGLDNLWDMWENKNHSQAVISVRGTTANGVSWLDNFYAALVPATGKIQIANDDYFDYSLSPNPRAAVHVGWLLSTGFLSRDMMPKIKDAYSRGIKNFLIVGHSQGGAISFLLTAYLYSLQQQGKLPQDIRFKTYCSAAPKPGNLYFAYSYEALTQNGWAFNVVNAADWVPQTPLSIQTLDDFNNTNPFLNAEAMIKKQKFPKNVAIKYVYTQLDKPTRTAQKRYEKYLGKMASKAVQKHLPGFVAPEYYPSNDYARCGNTILLQGGEDYYKLYPESKEQIFIHHFHPPYMYLAERLNY